MVLIEKNIVHVVNMDRVQREWLNIHIKRLEGTKSYSNFTIKARTQIKEFINTKFFECYNQNEEEIFLVYTGRQLDINKTFLDEFVED